MPRLLSIAALCLSLLALLPACQKDTDNDTRQVGFHPAGGRPLSNPNALPTPSTKLPPDPALSDAGMVNATPPPSVPTPATPPSRPAAKDIPYGIPVQGKPGLVVSPHSPNEGPIDVHGFAPGQEVVDPLTGKSFLVP